MSKKDEVNADNKKNIAQHNDSQVVLKYDIVVKTDKEFVVKLNGVVPMPLFFDPAGIHQAELNFKKIFEALVVDPVKLQVQNKIRSKQEELESEAAEEELEKSSQEANDVFMLASKKPEPDTTEEKNTEEKNTTEKNDQQQESSSHNPSKGGEQRDTEQKHSDGEWDTPDPISG